MDEAIKKNSFDLVVLGATLTRNDRHHLPYMVKKASTETRVLVMHADGSRHPYVDACTDTGASMEIGAEPNRSHEYRRPDAGSGGSSRWPLVQRGRAIVCPALISFAQLRSSANQPCYESAIRKPVGRSILRFGGNASRCPKAASRAKWSLSSGARASVGQRWKGGESYNARGI